MVLKLNSYYHGLTWAYERLTATCSWQVLSSNFIRTATKPEGNPTIWWNFSRPMVNIDKQATGNLKRCSDRWLRTRCSGEPSFQPSRAINHWKISMNQNFLPVRVPAPSFFSLLLVCDLRTSFLLPSDPPHLCLSEARLLVVFDHVFCSQSVLYTYFGFQVRHLTITHHRWSNGEGGKSQLDTNIPNVPSTCNYITRASHKTKKMHQIQRPGCFGKLVSASYRTLGETKARKVVAITPFYVSLPASSSSFLLPPFPRQTSPASSWS